MDTPADLDTLKSLLQQHLAATGSAVASRMLDQWSITAAKFKKIFPREYRYRHRLSISWGWFCQNQARKNLVSSTFDAVEMSEPGEKSLVSSSPDAAETSLGTVWSCVWLCQLRHCCFRLVSKIWDSVTRGI